MSFQYEEVDSKMSSYFPSEEVEDSDTDLWLRGLSEEEKQDEINMGSIAAELATDEPTWRAEREAWWKSKWPEYVASTHAWTLH